MVSALRLKSILSVIAVYSASAFTAPAVNNYRNVVRSSATTQLDIFGKAFANDESLGKRESAGLKKGPNFNEVTINGKPAKAVAGQKVSQVLAAARVKVTYSCREGNCGTCELLMNGRIEKACCAKMPRGKCTIQTY
mmetsp:Transcript_18597/g.39930  ORF Transcript_18597/g.39930 Transcript_18597/m.39930 type:complete len:137 (+) Transcript_18597:113-523(+)|eukprot:CAMPEP_0172526540 /NCGR_PEP_ID=MMETSP1067-20121228/1441_1 /TAXON_ID=265564 ORGANISM="Thalassiosira punctigera, Strain Tpunct2005C2" /NCGR_SAMPLE_ID=MMETSP1067 /ASSEMBLY_ACC=CAM_ASM_000444 /LENGTH=136 /DNA_ID=CAMNT_0013310073 /DNA_START=111 /DNA_END=521 /DNA_ORIENTATION=+